MKNSQFESVIILEVLEYYSHFQTKTNQSKNFYNINIWRISNTSSNFIQDQISIFFKLMSWKGNVPL